MPLSRFTEVVTGTGVSARGEDDNAPERIAVNQPGFLGRAETSGGGVLLVPNAPGGPAAEAIVDAVDGGIASARVTYHFGVVGPPTAAPIPLLIDASILVELEEGAIVTTDLASINVFAPGVIDETASVSACRPGPPVVCQNRARDLVFDLGLPLGDEGTIVLTALVGGAGGRIHALADPFMHIDSNFAGADLYQLVFSSNVSNTPPATAAVPTSSTATLALLALFGLVSRRARRELAPCAARRPADRPAGHFRLFRCASW